jgi:hypothetical protein
MFVYAHSVPTYFTIYFIRILSLWTVFHDVFVTNSVVEYKPEIQLKAENFKLWHMQPKYRTFMIHWYIFHWKNKFKLGNFCNTLKYFADIYVYEKGKDVLSGKASISVFLTIIKLNTVTNYRYQFSLKSVQ